MNLPRIFASALARRVAYVLVALVLGALGIDSVRAQDYSTCYGADRSGSCTDQGQAHSAVVAAAKASGIANMCPPLHIQSGANHAYRVNFFANQANCGATSSNAYIRYYPAAATCASKPSQTTQFFPPSGSVGCNLGCLYSYRQNVDETSTRSTTGGVCADKPDCSATPTNSVYNGFLGVCQPVEPTCPQGQHKVGNTCADEKPCPDGMALQNGQCKKAEEECPAGQMRSPAGNCVAADNTCAQGEARGKDGTCKRDADNDGEPDEGEDDGETKETFSGGDDCKSPPSCSGGVIMCGQARIQWRIECNTRKNRNISGGHCSQAGMPICTGEKCDAVEYQSLIMQWRSACAVEKMAAGAGQGSDSGQPDWTKVTGDGTDGGTGDADKPHRDVDVTSSLGRLDDGGFLGGNRACPQFPIADLGEWGQWNPNDLPHLCDFIALVRWTLMLLGAFIAFRIMAGG